MEKQPEKMGGDPISASGQTPGETLTDKQRVFVEEYLVCWNATEAAKRAGYSEKTAYAIGWENLRKPEIQAYIEHRLKTKAMSADEVLARLADQARGSMSDFLAINGRTHLDFKKAQQNGKLHLIKSFSKGKQGTKIELYDAQRALEDLAKYHKLFTESLDITSGGEPLKNDTAGLDRAISTLADALRETISGSDAGAPGAVAAPEQTPVAGSAEQGG